MEKNQYKCQKLKINKEQTYGLGAKGLLSGLGRASVYRHCWGCSLKRTKLQKLMTDHKIYYDNNTIAKDSIKSTKAYELCSQFLDYNFFYISISFVGIFRIWPEKNSIKKLHFIELFINDFKNNICSPKTTNLEHTLSISVINGSTNVPYNNNNTTYHFNNVPTKISIEITIYQCCFHPLWQTYISTHRGEMNFWFMPFIFLPWLQC